MKVLVFSDVHGNLPALEKMLKNEDEVELYISLGDVVNYGPWSNECVDLLDSINCVLLRGNHEEYFLAGTYPGKSELVQTFLKKCISSFDRMDSISRYEEERSIGSFICRHTINDIYLFPDSELKAKGNYFIGHSHHQFDRKEEEYHVINVGSVGQNRKEINVINYALYDTNADLVELKSAVYDTTPLIRKMVEEDYPQECIAYYVNKPRRM